MSSDDPRIRDYLKRHRPRFPPILRVVLLAGLAYVVTYLSLLAYLHETDRDLFEDMVRLYALTLLAGREPAMLAVYQPPTPVPLSWMLAVSILDDVGTLLLTLPWVWYAYQRLRGVGWLQSWLIGLEKTALQHRRWIRRWGLLGLAAFYWIPGLGSGVLAIVVMGVITHIPLRRLVPTLLLSAAGVAAFWAVALHGTIDAIPSGPAEYLPTAILGIVIVLGAIAVARRRQTAHVLLLEWPIDPAREDDLRAFGITIADGVWAVDTEILARRLGRDRLRRPEAKTLAELLLLPGMTPEVAHSMSEHGVGGILDLSVLDPALASDVLRVPEDQTAKWVDECRRLTN